MGKKAHDYTLTDEEAAKLCGFKLSYWHKMAGGADWAPHIRGAHRLYSKGELMGWMQSRATRPSELEVK